jgi:hypothetical protein
VRSTIFIAALLCVGLGGLFVGAMNLYNWAEFHFNGRAAMMRLADPAKRMSLGAPGGPDIYRLDVRYSGGGDEIVVPQKWLTRERAQKLLNGEGIQITYLRHDPSSVLYQGESPDSPWGWLTVGVAAMATFRYALKLKRREEHAA